jgi:hypothetical protein
MVTQNCFIDDRGLVTESKASAGKYFQVDGFFVHPTSKLLCYQSPKKEKKKTSRFTSEQMEHLKKLDLLDYKGQPAGDYRYVNLSTILEFLRGIWYEHKFVQHDQTKLVTKKVWSEVLKDYVMRTKTRAEWNMSEWEKISTHQLSKKELKTYHKVIWS